MIAKRRVLVSTIQDQQLMRDWASLWEMSPLANYTNSPAWLRAGLAAFQNERHYIVAVYRGTRLDAVVAVVRERRYGVDCLVRPGKFNCGTPFLVRNLNNRGVDTSKLVQQLLDLGNIVLEDIEAQDQVGVNHVVRQAVSTLGGYNYQIMLRSAKQANLSQMVQQIVPRAKNVFQEFILTEHKNLNNNVLQQIISLDAQSTKHYAGYSTFSAYEHKKFFHELLQYPELQVTGYLLYHISTQTPLAYDLGFIINNVYFSNQTATASLMHKYSPGRLILSKIIIHLAQNDIDIIDLGSGDNSYKRQFTQEGRKLYHVVASHNLPLVYYLSYIRRLQDWAYSNLVNHALYKRYRKLKTTLLRSKKL